jgi:hypothetical protein
MTRGRSSAALMTASTEPTLLRWPSTPTPCELLVLVLEHAESPTCADDLVGAVIAKLIAQRAEGAKPLLARACTMLAELGVPETLGDGRLGHHQPGVRSIYTHTTPAMRAAMIAELEARPSPRPGRRGGRVCARR